MLFCSPLTDLDSGPDFRFEFSRCLRIDLPGYFSLVYVAFFKPGTLGTFLGPTLAENCINTDEKQTKQNNIYIYIYISSVFPVLSPSKWTCG